MADPDRGQTFTLEAFMAAILLLASIAFALHVVSISSNTAGTADAETQSQHAGMGQGVLDEGAADGSLRETLLYWNATNESFHNTTEDETFYISQPPPTAFGGLLGAMFDDRQVRYNVDLYFENGTELGHQRLVESGTPSDQAVRVSETVTLYDDTKLLNETHVRTDTLSTVNDSSDRHFYAPDAKPDSRLYNVVRVEVVLWRS